MLPIAIIEDQPELRAALADYLGQQPEFDCVLLAGSVEEFLAGVGAVNPTPQLILSDIGLPGRSGIEGLPLLRQRLPRAQVIMLSVFTDAERVVEALLAEGERIDADGARLRSRTTAHDPLALRPRRIPHRGRPDRVARA